MMTIYEKVSIIIGDRNQHHYVLKKAVGIVREKFSGGFTVDELTSIDSFSDEDKKYLGNMFSHNITKVDAWEHCFRLHEDTWKYEISDRDYKILIRDILMLLNTSKTSIGEIVYADDYQLIENLWHDCLNLLDYETRWVLYEYHYFDEKEFIEFVCQNLKSKIGDSCIFNFEFLKAFMEAKSDYHINKAYSILEKAAQS
jgi:hypothetical protein